MNQKENIKKSVRGGEVPKPRIVSIDSGDRLPPTQEKGRKWKKI
jgi:hypothetical protein